VTGWLILINVAVHLLRQFLPAGLDDTLVTTFGYTTDSIYRPIGLMTLLTFISYQFLHAGWDHLGMNMLTLLAFGAGVERALGRIRFVILYFAAGVAGALLESAVRGPGGSDLLIGASGSISGLFGVLLVLIGFHRRARTPLRILTIIVMWSFILAATGILGVGANGSPVAWVDHIGGFIAGLLLGLLFDRAKGGIRPP
jgi:membrane associated rhomboid family serine protease